jgi:hypothetical protein
MNGMNWTPQQGWAHSGGDWTVAVGAGGPKGVFIETAKADFNNLFEFWSAKAESMTGGCSHPLTGAGLRVDACHQRRRPAWPW